MKVVRRLFLLLYVKFYLDFLVGKKLGLYYLDVKFLYMNSYRMSIIVIVVNFVKGKKVFLLVYEKY